MDIQTELQHIIILFYYILIIYLNLKLFNYHYL